MFWGQGTLELLSTISYSHFFFRLYNNFFFFRWKNINIIVLWDFYEVFGDLEKFCVFFFWAGDLMRI
jgi:hypothetical protein